MVKVDLSWHELSLGAEVGIQRQLEAMRQNRPDQHGYKGTGWENHIEGALGEVAFAKLFNLYWNGSINTFKEGGDVGETQVRTRKEAHYDLLVRPNDRDGDVFVLVTGRAPTFTIVGFIKGHAAKQPKWQQTYGNRPGAFFVPQKNLIQITPESVEKYKALRRKSGG